VIFSARSKIHRNGGEAHRIYQGRAWSSPRKDKSPSAVRKVKHAKQPWLNEKENIAKQSRGGLVVAAGVGASDGVIGVSVE